MTITSLIVLALLLGGCSAFTPDAGHEIVLFEKPWLFGHGGVQPESVKTGRTYGALTTQGVDVYMQPQKLEVELPDTMTSDGVPITFHAIIIVQVVDSVSLIKNFGPDWYRNNMEEQFKTMVRQAVRKRGMNETAISTSALDAIDAEIRDTLTAFIRLDQESAYRYSHPGTAHPDRKADQARGGSAHARRAEPRQC
ncbi:MAG: hypothetical protein NVS9B2_29120 [Steroidobacteraceae bacterium]